MSVFWIITISSIPILLILAVMLFFAFKAHRENSKIQLVRTENVQRIIDVMEDWFWAIENDTANERLPDPHGERYSEEYIDGFIRIVDGFFEDELREHPRYWQGKEHKKPELKQGKIIDCPPDFNRLQGASREAFVQEIKLMTKWLGAGK